MTNPLSPGIVAPTFAQPPLAPVSFPLGWLLSRAIPAIKFRAVTEVARLPLPDPAGFSGLPYTFPPALRLALGQRPDGTWNGAMLTIPPARAEHFEGIGTIPAVRRLVEYGWDREAPPLAMARRILFRLLAEDEDPAFLFELAPKGKPEPEAIHFGRGLLREAAASALAQAGYENDPRLRGAARRILGRVEPFLRSPLVDKPFVRVGNHHVLAPEITPPSIHLLIMMAYMPLFRSEHYDIMEQLYTYFTQPIPRQTPAVLVGKRIVPAPHVVLGDPLPHRNAADADVPWALTWLELAARLGFLRRNDNWGRLFERLLDDRDQSGVWQPPKRSATLRSSNPFVWPSFPLEVHATGGERISDVTFRLGLIARLSGRPIEVT
ncbi:MAG: hypothetical protein ACREON_19210 [Gemmatimonadaceae bacterium]